MSCALILQTPSAIFIGSDTAISTTINGKIYRLNESGVKLFPYDDRVIFCSGNVNISDTIIHEYHQTRGDLSAIAKKWAPEAPTPGKFPVDIAVCEYSKDSTLLTQISPYESFVPIERRVPQGIGVWAAGIRTNQAVDLACSLIEKNGGVIDIFQQVFDTISFEGVGGKLIVYRVDHKGVSEVYKGLITERPILRLAEVLKNSQLIVGERIMGRIIIGNNLHIENDNGSFRFDKDGAVIKDADLTINHISAPSRILMNATDGIKIQKNDGSSWMNQLSLDAQGNIVLSGGIIAWGNVTPPTAIQVGARPYDWNPAYGDIVGAKPQTYIDANGIYT